MTASDDLVPHAAPAACPRPPPFPIGARVRYEGTRRVHSATGPILEPGMVMEIVLVDPGRPGRGLLSYVDDDGHSRIDPTQHGCSIYVSPDGHARAIPADYAVRGDRWTVVGPRKRPPRLRGIRRRT
jgi:hypothetical protein